MNVKQVIVLRTKYPDGKGGTGGLRLGKLAAQASHASIAWLTNRIPMPLCPLTTQVWRCEIGLHTAEMLWIGQRFTKIVLGVETEEELVDTYERAASAGLESHLIIDAGLTEFHGVPTKTAVGIGPDDEESINKITGPDAVTCCGKKYKLL